MPIAIERKSVKLVVTYGLSVKTWELNVIHSCVKYAAGVDNFWSMQNLITEVSFCRWETLMHSYFELILL